MTNYSQPPLSPDRASNLSILVNPDRIRSSITIMRAQGPPLTKQFLGYLRIEKGLSENTIKNYAKDFARLTHYAYQAGQQIQDLRPSDLRTFIAQLSRAHLSPATVRRIASAVRGLRRPL
jgi:integrase/recombinase XerD